MQIIMFFTVPFPAYTKLLWRDIYKGWPFDIAFVGDSIVFRSTNPQIISEKLNKNVIVLASASQSIMDSYYAIKELYKKGPCELIFLEVSYRRLRVHKTIFASKIVFDYMSPSINKMQYLLDAFPDDYRLNALFPGIQTININSLQPKAMINLAKRKILNPNETYSPDGDQRYIKNGFVETFKSLENLNNLGKLSVQGWDRKRVNTESLNYYKKIIDFCLSKGSRVILYLPPLTFYNMAAIANYEEFNRYVNDFAQENNVSFINFNYSKPSIFRAETKYYRDTRHMNRMGAKNFSEALAEFLINFQKDSYNENDYFYHSYDEAMAEWKEVFGVWLVNNNKINDLEARAYSPPHTPVEFEFSIVFPSGEYEVYRPYSENKYAETEKLSAGIYKIRVNARLVGSIEDFQQYYITDKPYVVKEK